MDKIKQMDFSEIDNLLASPDYIKKCKENDSKKSDYNKPTSVSVSKHLSFTVFNKTKKMTSKTPVASYDTDIL